MGYGGKIAIVCDSARAKSVPIEKAVAASFERGRLFGSRAAKFGVTSCVNQNRGSRVAAPIVMIPARVDVESILRTWTPDSPYDIPLKGAQTAESSAQSVERCLPVLSGEEPSLHACGPLA